MQALAHHADGTGRDARAPLAARTGSGARESEASRRGSAARILAADDQRDVLEALRLLLKDRGYELRTAGTPVEVLRAVEATEFDVLLLDLNYARDTTSGREGLDLLPRIREIDPSLPVLVMTAWGSIEGAVEAMRRGARDYIEKPWDNDRLLVTLETQVELARALRTARRLEAENRRLRDRDLPVLIAESASMRPVLRLIDRIGPSDANVLIVGEPGTGKEVVGRWLHARSERADRPLIVVNAGALAEGVFESEMFGHVKGAFTDAKTDRTGYFERAHRGTLFLDEIGTIPLRQQAKLLRVLESGELQPVGSTTMRRVDVRVISATNTDIEAEVAAEDFREDLYYRLNAVEIRLPPLRDRRDDIPLLAVHFLREAAGRYDIRDPQVAPEAMRVLLAHAWPGNIRELRHAVERALLMAPDGQVGPEHLALRARAGGAAASIEEMTLEDAERVLVRRSLDRHGGNVSRAAEDLGVSRSALYRRMERYHIQA